MLECFATSNVEDMRDVGLATGSALMPDTAQHAFRAIEHLVFSDAPTPLVSMDRLGEILGKPAGTLFVKRDDLTGLCAGGNKVRKLEYVVADALRTGATCLVTGGGVQSNSARVTAAAAAMHGLRCRMVAGRRGAGE